MERFAKEHVMWNWKPILELALFLPLNSVFATTHTTSVELESLPRSEASETEQTFSGGPYSETLSRNESIYHENTTSTNPINRRTSYRELCANSAYAAWKFTKKSNQLSSVSRHLSDWSQTDMYYDFKMTDGDSVLHSRVFKCGFADVKAFDKWNGGKLRGYFKKRPMEPKDVKKFLDYLQFLDTYNIAGSGIVDSTIKNRGTYLEYRVTLKSKTFGDWGLPDYEYSTDEIYNIDKQTGAIVLSSSSRSSTNPGR
jgi:hypothetical protein